MASETQTIYFKHVPTSVAKYQNTNKKKTGNFNTAMINVYPYIKVTGCVSLA